jgi:hypothetical protein
MIAKAETTTTAVSAATRAREGAEVLRVNPAGVEHAAKRDARSGDFESAAAALIPSAFSSSARCSPGWIAKRALVCLPSPNDRPRPQH